MTWELATTNGFPTQWELAFDNSNFMFDSDTVGICYIVYYIQQTSTSERNQHHKW